MSDPYDIPRHLVTREMLWAEVVKLRAALEHIAAIAGSPSEASGYLAREALRGAAETKAPTGEPGELLGCKCMMCEFHRSAEALERKRRAVKTEGSNT